MKKLLSLLVALMMLLPMAAMAEEEFAIYVDPTDTYGFAYPSGWVVLDKETIAEAMQTYEGDDELSAIMESALPQMEQVEMVMVISPDGLNNVNLVVTDLGGTATAQDLLAQSGVIQSTLMQSMPGIEFSGEAELIAVGDYEYVLMAYMYPLSGETFFGMQAYTCAGTKLYAFTLTSNVKEETHIEVASTAMSMVLMTAELN